MCGYDGGFQRRAADSLNRNWGIIKIGRDESQLFKGGRLLALEALICTVIEVKADCGWPREELFSSGSLFLGEMKK